MSLCPGRGLRAPSSRVLCQFLRPPAACPGRGRHPRQTHRQSGLRNIPGNILQSCLAFDWANRRSRVGGPSSRLQSGRVRVRELDCSRGHRPNFEHLYRGAQVSRVIARSWFKMEAVLTDWQGKRVGFLSGKACPNSDVQLDIEIRVGSGFGGVEARV